MVGANEIDIDYLQFSQFLIRINEIFGKTNNGELVLLTEGCLYILHTIYFDISNKWMSVPPLLQPVSQQAQEDRQVVPWLYWPDPDALG
jgi:hypothetical protein